MSRALLEGRNITVQFGRGLEVFDAGAALWRRGIQRGSCTGPGILTRNFSWTRFRDGHDNSEKAQRGSRPAIPRAASSQPSSPG